MYDNLKDHRIEGSKWLVLISAFVYSSGFLIVYTNISRLGLIDLWPFFKMKYIHVGIIYTTLLIILLIPPILFFYLLKLSKRYKKRYRFFGIFWGDKLIHFMTIAFLLITIFLWSITFYFFGFFSIHGELRTYPLLIGFNFVPIFLTFMMRNIIDLCHWLKITDKNDPIITQCRK